MVATEPGHNVEFVSGSENVRTSNSNHTLKGIFYEV